MQAASDEGPITSINVTPLVDIILVVLIIFMATAPLISRRVLKVDVPKAAHHERAATEAIQIVYNAKREVLLEGKHYTLEQLSAMLTRSAASQPELHVTLSGDKSIAYGEIVGLLDVIRGAGVRKIGLEVVRK
jgi:biopolymer transport protein ExbD